MCKSSKGIYLANSLEGNKLSFIVLAAACTFSGRLVCIFDFPLPCLSITTGTSVLGHIETTFSTIMERRTEAWDYYLLLYLLLMKAVLTMSVCLLSPRFLPR
ncbi:hypothetical protein AcW1_009631 [Taiwanofungus camphoratus]|nr:hypothetical protein AcV5_002470 [Antrodia cinnamomea]KAI0948014.1 hypothetical protein AcW1_009631 [Antrodia cinnamomea]